MSQETCPICFYKPVKEYFKGMDSASNRDLYHLDCSRCGAFEISGTFTKIIKNKELSSVQIGLLSGHIKDANLNHQQLKLDEYNTDANDNNFEKWLSQLSKTTTEKQNKLLIALEKLMPEPGETIIISLDTDISLSLAWAASKNELKFHLETLHEREFIYLYSTGNEDLDDFSGRKVKILGKGWERIEQLTTDFSANVQVFVAMNIGDSWLDAVYKNHIKQAIQSSGYKAYRIDYDQKNMERLDNKIIKEIKNSRFLVADVSNQRQSVYYEAGYAHGLGIPVIWSVQNADKENLHFDTRQFPHQIWQDGQQLEEKLTNAILAQIGQGPIIHDV